MPKVDAYIGIGSNLGDRRDFCSRALGLLGLLPRSALPAILSLMRQKPSAMSAGHFSIWSPKSKRNCRPSACWRYCLRLNAVSAGPWTRDRGRGRSILICYSMGTRL